VSRAMVLTNSPEGLSPAMEPGKPPVLLNSLVAERVGEGASEVDSGRSGGVLSISPPPRLLDAAVREPGVATAASGTGASEEEADVALPSVVGSALESSARCDAHPRVGSRSRINCAKASADGSPAAPASVSLPPLPLPAAP